MKHDPADRSIISAIIWALTALSLSRRFRGAVPLLIVVRIAADRMPAIQRLGHVIGRDPPEIQEEIDDALAQIEPTEMGRVEPKD